MDWRMIAAIIGLVVSIGILIYSRKKPIVFGFGVWGVCSALGVLMEAWLK
jgi:hypothetical protein